MQNDCLAREEIEEEERGSGKGKRRKGIFGLSPPPAPGGSKLPRISHLQISEESSGRAARLFHLPSAECFNPISRDRSRSILNSQSCRPWHSWQRVEATEIHLVFFIRDTFIRDSVEISGKIRDAVMSDFRK